MVVTIRTRIYFRFLILIVMVGVFNACSEIKKDEPKFKIFDAFIFDYKSNKLPHSGQPIIKFTINIEDKNSNDFIVLDSNDELYLINKMDSLRLIYIRPPSDTINFLKKSTRKLRVRTRTSDLNKIIDSTNIVSSVETFLKESYIYLKIDKREYRLSNPYSIHYIEFPSSYIKNSNIRTD